MSKRTEATLSALIVKYLDREIGRLMHQAEFWAATHPLATHHRLRMADAYFQIRVLFDGSRQRLGYSAPFDQIRDRLASPEIKPAGAYPASADLFRFNDPVFVAALPAMPGDGPRPVVRYREALEAIANGSGTYGAQALEYKNIARKALGREPL